MSKINDGGPAFPGLVETGMAQIGADGTAHTVFGAQGGMTIRDWFAGQALTAIIAADGAQYFHESEAHARLAYNHADAMLAARKGGAS